MTPLTLSSVSCKFKVNLLEPRQLEPNGYGSKGQADGQIQKELFADFVFWQKRACALHEQVGHFLLTVAALRSSSTCALERLIGIF